MGLKSIILNAGGSIPIGDLQPIAPETIVANPTNSTASPQAVTVGVENGFIGTTLVSVLDLADYANITGGADATVVATNFSIAGFINSIVRGAMDKGNTGSRCRTLLRSSTGYPLTLTSPLPVLPFTDWNAPLQILRNFPSSGSASAFYNGDPTSQAFNNLAMPTVFISTYGHASEISVDAAPNANIGAGIAGPRYWQMLSGGSGAIVGSQGNGLYQTGDIVTASVGGLPSPFAAPQFSVTVSGGNITVLTPVTSHLGILPMPPKMMRAAMGDVSGNFVTAWTNPVNDGPTWETAVAATATTKATAVYDTSGNYITTTNSVSGSGMTINIPDDATAWNPDFSGANPTYLFQNAQCDTILGNIKFASVATTLDATYGPIIGWMLGTGEHFINNIAGTGGYYGFYPNGIDIAINAAHITDSFCCLKIASGGDLSCPTMILDSALDHYAEIDSCEGVRLSGRCFTASSTDITGTAAMYIGSHSNSTTQNRNLKLDFEFDNAGKSTGIPAASIAYIQASDINFSISNIESKTGASAAKQISSFASFGSGVANNNRITGRIDGVFGQIYSGTLPRCYFDIWDAEVALQYGSITATITGSATNNDTITFAAVNIGLPMWGAISTTSLTIGTGSKTLTIAAGLNFIATQVIAVVSAASPANAMIGTVTSYNASTGSLVFSCNQAIGSGTIASWNITNATAQITVTTSETTTQQATAIAAAINSAATLTNFGASATTNAANVVNFFQSGSQANNTTIFAYVSGSATEIVTLSNSGAISGAQSGGVFGVGGVYTLIGSGPPTSGSAHSTGLNKAIGGSSYEDYANNNIYTNDNTAASPQWVLSSAIVAPSLSATVATIQASDTSGLTYLNGAGGIGATFVGTINTALTVDGVTFSALGQTLLVKNDTQSPSGAFNGLYYVTQLQTTLLPPVLTRSLTYDQPSEINGAGPIAVISGTVNANTSWLQTSTIITIGTTPLTYTQFSYAPSTIQKGTFATKPGSPVAGQQYFATDLGANGTTIIYSGSIWKPAAGTAVLANTGTATGTTNSPTTVTLATVTIPAGLLSANGQLRISATPVATGANGTKTFNVRFSASSGSGAGTSMCTGALSTSQLSAAIIRNLYNSNSTGAQVCVNSGNAGTGQSTGTVATSAINTTNASYINFDGQTANSGDTIGYAAYTVEWIES